ncbi:hypothetical protein J3Q64DRAFT_1772654 [Phycomyces blakesleeanus]|uniref:RRM domain-containing protein n=1 Tax=Phycomyces blakesleeanus TaxID=4837 RepID=A0ABR3AL14_PHYBL
MVLARKQVDQATIDEFFKERKPEGGAYNIWHHRYQGLDRDWSKKGLRSKFRCKVARDAGDTAGTSNPHAYFCLYFAKGMCAQGHKCAMWHRIPTEKDEQETTIDCFGRDKFAEFRQDMGGVGSFNTLNRTLYVGRIAVTPDIEEVVTRNFEEWGRLERVRVLKNRGVAFVTYATRSNAEFAREAMMNQNLDHNEIINVRWATVDPNSIGNRMDSDEEETERKQTEDVYQYQASQSELPAEFTQTKRDVDEDGFSNMEMRVKRQRAEEAGDFRGPYYDTESAMAIYGYTQPIATADASSYCTQPATDEVSQSTDHNPPDQNHVLAYQTPASLASAPTHTLKAGGIIPINVLNSLKSLSNQGKGVAPSVQPKQNILSSLTNYNSGSESESDD